MLIRATVNKFFRDSGVLNNWLVACGLFSFVTHGDYLFGLCLRLVTYDNLYAVVIDQKKINLHVQEKIRTAITDKAVKTNLVIPEHLMKLMPRNETEEKLNIVEIPVP